MGGGGTVVPGGEKDDTLSIGRVYPFLSLVVY